MDYNKEKHRVLLEYFGYNSFRTGQEEVIDNLCGNNDVICVMPTGAGKSVCYEIPALMFDGITLVISPLISLMHDQVMSLRQYNIPAAYINSTLTAGQLGTALRRMSEYAYKLVYVSPERLESEYFQKVCSTLNISMVIADEAHCVSQWGQQFRPSYLGIADFISCLPERPVVGAFTATATPEVKSDIAALLKLKAPYTITTGFDRPNLYFSVCKPESKLLKLLTLIDNRRCLSGIVYCSTRVDVENVCDALKEYGVPAARYHAGLTMQERQKSQDDFLNDRKLILVATNAFGMGVDKPNISYIIHFSMPKDLESYYQEAGRAGRDGNEADCILLFSQKDVRVAESLCQNINDMDIDANQKKSLYERSMRRTKYMSAYCSTGDCLRAYMLRYFGEKTPNYCGKCSNCLTKLGKADITVDAQKILSCLVRVGGSCSLRTLCDILRGAENDYIISKKFDKLSTYGIMAESSVSSIQRILNTLVRHKYLELVTDNEPVLKIGQDILPILKGEQRLEENFLMRGKERKSRGEAASDDKLLENLKVLRLSLAKKASVPSFSVFSDSVLLAMCRQKPKNIKQMSEISGIDRAKLDRYGEAFLNVINNFDGS